MVTVLKTEEEPVARVIHAHTLDGTAEYIERQEDAENRSWRWAAPLEDWTDTVTADDPRWARHT